MLRSRSASDADWQPERNWHLHLPTVHKTPFPHFIEHFIKSDADKIAELQFRDWAGISGNGHSNSGSDNGWFSNRCVEYACPPEFFIKAFRHRIDTAELSDVFTEQDRCFV